MMSVSGVTEKISEQYFPIRDFMMILYILISKNLSFPDQSSRSELSINSKTMAIVILVYEKLHLSQRFFQAFRDKRWSKYKDYHVFDHSEHNLIMTAFR